MYCSHFGLHRPPFNNTPDPSFYYRTPDHEEALASLQYATLHRKGFVLITGEVGAGKTLIGRMFIRQVDRQASTAVIAHTQLNGRQLLAAICSEFEIDVPPDATNLQLTDRLQEYLIDQFARDRFVVVLIDEAQNLPDEGFEALRMLGNLEADDAKLLQVCILGQPELRERFQQESLRQLDQRLFRRFHLSGLTRQQTAEYIQRRLSVAGCSRSDLFSPDALDAVYAGSHGIPRLINQVCDNCLLAAYAQNLAAVEASIVTQVLEQEDLPEVEPRADRAPARSRRDRARHRHDDGGAVALACPTASALADDEETLARIERIYGTTPEFADAVRPPPVSSILTQQIRQELMDVQQRLETGLAAAAKAEDLGRLSQGFARQQDEIGALVRDANARLDAVTSTIDELKANGVTAARLDQLRDEHRAALDDVLARLEARARDLAALKEALDGQFAQLSRQQNDSLAALVNRADEQDKQLRQLRRRLIENQAAVQDRFVALRQEFATRTELEQAIKDHAAQAAGLIERLQSDRRAVQSLMDEVAERFRATHERIEVLDDAARTGGDQLAELRRGHAEDVASLLRQIEDQRRASQEQFDRLLANWTRSREEIEQLRTTAAEATAVEELRQRQSRQAGRILQIMADRKRSLESLIRAVDGRCDELLARVNALPAGIATHDDLESLRAEALAHKAAADQAVRAVVEQIQQTASALRDEIQARQASFEAALRTVTDRVEQATSALHDENEARKTELHEAVDSMTSRIAQTMSGLRDEAASRKLALEEAVGLVTGRIEQATSTLRDEAQAQKTSLNETMLDIAGRADGAVSALRDEIRSHRTCVDEAIRGVDGRIEQTAAGLREEALAQRAATDDSVHLVAGQVEHTASVLRDEIRTHRTSVDEAVRCLAGRIEQTTSALHDEAESRKAALDEAVGAVVGRIERTAAALREEAGAQEASLDQAIRCVAGRIEQTESALQDESRARETAVAEAVDLLAGRIEQTTLALRRFEERAAAAEEDARQIRETQTEAFQEIARRIDARGNEHREQFHALKAELAQVIEHRRRDAQAMTQVVRQLTERVGVLEEMERPTPVQLQLQPQAAEELSRTIAAAEQRADSLRGLLDAAGETGTRLQNASAQVEPLMNQWSQTAAAVQQQSEQLRASVTTSANILQAMRQYHEALDAKMKSKRWRTELQTHRQLTAQLEQVVTVARTILAEMQASLDDCERVRNETHQLAGPLGRLVTEAKTSAQHLNKMTLQVRALAVGIARKTDGLAEVVEAAREFDDERRPIPPAGSGHKPDRQVAPVNWPKYRTHATAAAG